MSIAEGESVQVVDMSSQGLNEEHVNSTFIATAAVSNNISSSQTGPGKSSPKMITVTSVKTTDASSCENKHRPSSPSPSRDMRVHLEMPGNHNPKSALTVNQLIWFLDYMVAESSTFSSNNLPFDWPQDITHCHNGRQYIISELVREYFSDQIKQAKKSGSEMSSCTVETDGDCFIKLVNEEDKTYDKISILVNYSRSGQPNRLEVVYDEVEIPYKTPEEIRAEIRRQKTFSVFDSKRNETLKRKKEKQLAASMKEIEEYKQKKGQITVSFFDVIHFPCVTFFSCRNNIVVMNTFRFFIICSKKSTI